MFVLSQCDFCSPVRRFCTTRMATCKGPINSCTMDTHVQYTQTNTIRQTDGPLVPMVRLVNKARSKYKHAMCILRSISHLCETSSLLYQVKHANSYYGHSLIYKLTTQNNFALTQSRNALTVISKIQLVVYYQCCVLIG